VGEQQSSGKSFVIGKVEVWEAWEVVKANKGAAGVDGMSIAVFETDLKDQLYKIWNRMSSGAYFPPAVKAVQIPKPHGGGVRVLGIPTVADLPSGLVRLPAGAFGPRRGAGMPAAVLALRLGPGPGYREVLRHRGS
jgi:hypothetical protein